MRGCRVSGLLRGVAEFLTDVKVSVGVCCEHVFRSVTGQFVVGDWLGAGGAETSGAGAAHEGPVLGAILLAECSGATSVALVDGGGPAGLAIRQGGRFQRGRLVTATVTGVSASISTASGSWVLSAHHRPAGDRYAVVT